MRPLCTKHNSLIKNIEGCDQIYSSVVLVCDGTSTISYSMFFKAILKF